MVEANDIMSSAEFAQRRSDLWSIKLFENRHAATSQLAKVLSELCMCSELEPSQFNDVCRFCSISNLERVTDVQTEMFTCKYVVKFPDPERQPFVVTANDHCLHLRAKCDGAE